MPSSIFTIPNPQHHHTMVHVLGLFQSSHRLLAAGLIVQCSSIDAEEALKCHPCARVLQITSIQFHKMSVHPFIKLYTVSLRATFQALWMAERQQLVV